MEEYKLAMLGTQPALASREKVVVGRRSSDKGYRHGMFYLSITDIAITYCLSRCLLDPLSTRYPKAQE